MEKALLGRRFSTSQVRQRARPGATFAEGVHKGIRPTIVDTDRFRHVEKVEFDVVVARQWPGYNKTDTTLGTRYVGSLLKDLMQETFARNQS